MTFAVEKAFDIVLDALIEKSKDEIDDILQKSKRKKMLQKTLRFPSSLEISFLERHAISVDRFRMESVNFFLLKTTKSRRAPCGFWLDGGG